MATFTPQADVWQLSGDVLIGDVMPLLKTSEKLSLARVVDFKAVEAVDTATLSLMMEWQRRAIAEKINIQFANMPDNLVSLAVLYGVTALIPV